MTRAREIGPCFENTATATVLCGGASDPVWRGRISPWAWSRAEYLDLLTVPGGPTILAYSDAFPSTPLKVEIAALTNATSLPPTIEVRGHGLQTTTFGVQLFEYDDRVFLGTVSPTDVDVHDISGCDSSAAACDFSERVVRVPTSNIDSINWLSFSIGSERPFLYKGSHSLCSRPPTTSQPAFELLLDLSGLASGGDAVPIIGESYLDPGHTAPQRRIDYWSSYYDQSTLGYSAFAPVAGKFFGRYLYRGAQSILDIHEWTGGPPSTIFTDGFETGDTSAWDG